MKGLLIPSIDISNGLAVKRVRGVKGSELIKLRVSEAIEMVKGYPLVHVVDLDGAEAGRPINLDSISLIGKALDGKCQAGGGVRSIDDARSLLKWCSRVVLGTVVVENKALLRDIINDVGEDKVAISLDVYDGWLMVKGWRVKAKKVVDAINDLPRVGAVIYTNVNVEGTGLGPSIDPRLISELRRASGNIYYAGGVSDCKDAEMLWSMGFTGVIVGYAFYMKGVRCGG